MRAAYQEQLEDTRVHLVTMADRVSTMVAQATTALLEGDLRLAESVVAADAVVNESHDHTDEMVVDLLARQAPVAGDLRQVLSALRISADLERMGDLAAHIAKVARMRYPEVAVPDAVAGTFAELGERDAAIGRKTARMLASNSVELCQEILTDDDGIDRLHRSLFMVVLERDWPGSTEQAVDLVLLGRYYERYADHAVLIATYVDYLVTGTYNRPAPRTA
jgi:phosphate transport system protein